MPTNNISTKYHKDDSEDLTLSYLDDIENTNKNLKEIYQAESEEIPSAGVDIETENYSVNKPRRITIRAKVIP